MNSPDKRLKPGLRSLWGRVSKPWRAALFAWIVSRLVYTLWSCLILLAFPVVIQNLDLLGRPVLTVFNLHTSQRQVYLRMVDQETLDFVRVDNRMMRDLQTATVWELASGLALAGPYEGRRLVPGPDTDEIFPYQGVTPSSIAWLAIWQRFDANWYQSIAENGYGAVEGSLAYFPLYPVLIRMMAPLLGGPFAASLILSNISLLVALALLYQVTVHYTDDSTAGRTLAYLMVFPASFFLVAGYSESTFLMFSLAALLLGLRHQWLAASILGGLAALTRGVGLLLILPLVYLWWIQGPSRRWQDGLTFLLIPLSTAGFMLAGRFTTFSSLQSGWSSRLVFPWEHFVEFARLAAIQKVLPGDLINLAATVLFGLLCIGIWIKLPRELGIYAAGMFLVPLLRINEGQPFVSMVRYVLAIFPAFILLAGYGRNAWVNRIVLYLGLPALLFFSAQFWMWGWIA